MDAIRKMPVPMLELANYLDDVSQELNHLQQAYQNKKTIPAAKMQAILELVQTCDQSLSNKKVSAQGISEQDQAKVERSIQNFLQIKQEVAQVLFSKDKSLQDKMVGVQATITELGNALNKLADHLKDKKWKIGAKVAETHKGKQT